MTKYIFFITVSLILFFSLPSANAEYYTWEDESGVTHITNYPPPQTAITKKVQVHNFEPAGASTTGQDNAAAKDQTKPEVTLYTKNDCPECDKAREFLQSQNVEFSEFNMDNNPEAVSRRKSVDDSVEVPFAIINRNHVYGFSESVYNRVLKLLP